MIDRRTIIQNHIKDIKYFVKNHGPDRSEWDDFDVIVNQIYKDIIGYNLSAEEKRQIQEAFGESLEEDTIMGNVFRKPYGYSGDFMVIDNFYTGKIIDNKLYEKWDLHVQNSIAAEALRNRKTYLKNLLNDKIKDTNKGINMLNIASGSCRDIMEFFKENNNANIHIDCVEQDINAINFAKNLFNGVKGKINYYHKNAMFFRTRNKYDIIWSAGLFDYLEDDIFIRLLRRIYQNLKLGGEMIIGNFSHSNPSKSYMELMDWKLFYRDEKQLLGLVKKSAINHKKIIIEKEQLGINLFVHIQS